MISCILTNSRRNCRKKLGRFMWIIRRKLREWRPSIRLGLIMGIRPIWSRGRIRGRRGMMVGGMDMAMGMGIGMLVGWIRIWFRSRFRDWMIYSLRSRLKSRRKLRFRSNRRSNQSLTHLASPKTCINRSSNWPKTSPNSKPNQIATPKVTHITAKQKNNPKNPKFPNKSPSAKT